MMTCSFFRMRNIPDGMEPVSIARGHPRWYNGRKYLPLAPTWHMIKGLSRHDYCREFDAMLDQLDAEDVYRELGENAVLLCWEPPNVFCHRRMVAEWLEDSLGVNITEVGFARDEVLSYVEMPDKQPKKRSGKRS